MKPKLYKKYNKLKKGFITEIIKFLKSLQDDKGLVTFAEPIVIYNYPEKETETITEIQYTKDGWYAHAFFTDDITDETEEYWFTLEELSMDELFEIADLL